MVKNQLEINLLMVIKKPNNVHKMPNNVQKILNNVHKKKKKH